MPRPVGKYGRNPFDMGRKHLVLERYLDPRARMGREGLPQVPLSADVDRASEVASWPMYLNNELGDCTIAGAGHMFGALTAYCGGEALFTDQEIQSVYSAVGGYVSGNLDTDQGCVMADVLAYLKATGMTDTAGKVHKVAGYARLGNPADEDLLGQVLDVTGTVYTGVVVQSHLEQAFADGQVWSYQPGDQAVGGHCITLQRRFPAGTDGVYEYVTWGALQPADLSFQAQLVEEAWFVVSEDFIRANGTSIAGLDLEQMLADMADV